MKLPLASGRSGSEQTTKEEQFQEAVTEAIRESSDKEIVIRPAEKSGGSGLLRMALIAGAFGAIALWLRRSEKPTQSLKQTASKAAGTIEREGETVSERVEEGSQVAGERVQKAGDQAAETVEQGSEQAGERIQETGEEAADATEEASETAAEKTEASGSSSSDS